jgi:hypothetical protein
MFETDPNVNRDESPESGTPEVADTEQEEGQTQHPAPEEDVGAAPHEGGGTGEEEADED